MVHGRVCHIIKILLDADQDLLYANLLQSRSSLFGDWIATIARRDRWSHVSELVRSAGWKHVAIRQQKRDIFIPKVQVMMGECVSGSVFRQ